MNNATPLIFQTDNQTGLTMSTTLSPTPADVTFIDEDPMQKTLSDYVEISILMMCFTIGAPLNLISFYKLFRSFKRSSQYGALSSRMMSSGGTQINLLRLHLNIADLMTIFVYTTSQIGWLSARQWLGGDFLCRVIKFFHTFVFYLTSFVIVCIAIDRVFGAYKLNSFKSSKRAFQRCKKMLVIAWSVAGVLSLPQSYIFSVVEPPTMKGFFQCATVWMAERSILEEESRNPFLSPEEQKQLYYEYVDTGRWEMAYNICHLLFVFWIPVLVIVSSYMSILCILNNFSRQRDDFFDEIKVKPSFLSTFFPPKIVSRQSNEKQSSTSLVNAPESEPFSSSSLPNFSKHSHKLHVNPFFECAEDKQRETSKISGSRLLEKENQNPAETLQKERLKFKRSNSEQLKTALILQPALIRNSGGSTPLVTNRDRSFSKVGPMALQTIAIARQKTKRQAAFILIAYLTLWTPYNILAIVNIFVPPEFRGPLLTQVMVIMPFMNSLIVINAIINPLIYGVFDRLA